MIAFRGVGKQYKNGPVVHEVLRDVNLDIESGSFVALMGPSGSGKTTLLNLMGGLDRQTTGTIEVSSHNLGSLSSRQLARWRSRHIGFVFQSYNLMPGLDAADNVALPLALTSLSRAETKDRAVTALEIVGLSAYCSHRPGQLSGGQQQRVAIARAIVTDPNVLLCDEPTGNLDRSAANNILDVLSLLNQHLGKTVVIATHDPLCAEHASRLISLDKGVLQDRPV